MENSTATCRSAWLGGMDLATVPGLVPALRDHGYRLRGPAGTGARGTSWAAESEAGRRVVVGVLELGRTLAERRSARSRLEVLRTVVNPHLVPLLDVLELDDDRVALVTGAVEGPTVGAVLEVREQWRAGEVVTLLVPLAQALAALHAVGLVHGDVAPENIVLAPGGRPVLIDLDGVVRPGRGTPGYAERRARGAAPGDVFALASLGLAVLGDEPDGAVTELHRLLESVCRAEPAARPGATAVAAACFDLAAPEPLDVPPDEVMARIALPRLGAREPVVHTVRDPVAARRRRLRSAALVGVAATVATALAVGLGASRPAVGPARQGPVAGPAELGTSVEAEVAGPKDAVVAAAVTLTERRAELLSDGSTERLEEVTVLGSPAFDADTALLESLAARGETVQVRAEVVEARRLPPDGDRELVLVTSAHRATGAAVADGPRTVVLALVRTPAGWRVAEVLDPTDEQAAQAQDPVSALPRPLAG